MESRNAEYYRRQAQRIRLQAAAMTSDVIRRQVLRLAAEFELLAESVKAAERGKDPD